jgi:uncharacterized membrane protein
MRFDDVAGWMFVIAVLGTLAFPLAMGIAVWVALPRRQARRLLVGTGAWVAFTAVATIARLVTEDAYYSPRRITHWAHADPDTRRAMAAWIVTAAAAAVAALVLSRLRPSTATAAAVAIATWLVCVPMLAYSISLGLH